MVTVLQLPPIAARKRQVVVPEWLRVTNIQWPNPSVIVNHENPTAVNSEQNWLKVVFQTSFSETRNL
jgi:hypothetical protein